MIIISICSAHKKILQLNINNYQIINCVIHAFREEQERIDNEIDSLQFKTRKGKGKGKKGKGK